MRTLVEVIRHQVDGHAVDNFQAVAAAFQTRFQQVIGERGGAAFPANRLPGLVNDLPVQERLFGDGDIVGIGIEIDSARIVTHQQGFDDGLT
ncbi:hypothetical protein D3C72_1376050 [compost metagenome]